MNRSESRRCTVALLLLGGLALLAVACSRGVPAPPAPDGARAYANLVQQVEFGPRTPNSRGINRTRRWLLNELQQHTDDVATQMWSIANPYAGDDSTEVAVVIPDTMTFMNILAHFNPESTDRVLLGAHYDTRPWADSDTASARAQPVPGANDAASGVAVLLEVAHALGQWDPGFGVDLVFFDAEDFGREGDLQYYIMGSKYFVNTMGAYRPEAMILVDMVGDADLQIPMEGYSMHAAPELTKLVFSVAESIQAPGFVQAIGDTVFDDHIPFLRVGIPAIDLIDFTYEPWHTVRDTPDKCSPASLESVSRVLLATLHRFALRRQE